MTLSALHTWLEEAVQTVIGATALERAPIDVSYSRKDGEQVLTIKVGRLKYDEGRATQPAVIAVSVKVIVEAASDER